MPTSLRAIVSRRHEYCCNGTRGEEAVKSNLLDGPKYKSISRSQFLTLVTQLVIYVILPTAILFFFFVAHAQQIKDRYCRI